MSALEQEVLWNEEIPASEHHVLGPDRHVDASDTLVPASETELTEPAHTPMPAEGDTPQNAEPGLELDDQGDALPKRSLTELLSDHATNLQVTMAIRDRLAANMPSLPEMVKHIDEEGAIPFLVTFLTHDHDNDPELQYESVGALANLVAASPTHTDVIINLGVLSSLVDMLAFEPALLRIEVAWCLSKIAWQSVEHRNKVLAADIMPRLVAFLEKALREPVASAASLEAGSNILVQLCRGQPKPDWQTFVPLLAHVNGLVHAPPATFNTLWFLSSTVTEDAHAQAIVETGMMSRVIELMGNDATSAQIKDLCLRLITATVEVEPRDCPLHCSTAHLSIDCPDRRDLIAFVATPESMQGLKQFLEPTADFRHRDFACRIMATVALRGTKFVQLVLDAELARYVVNLLDAGPKESAIMALTNLITRGTRAQERQFVAQGALKGIAEAMPKLETECQLCCALESVGSLIKHESMTWGTNDYAIAFRDAGTVDFLHSLAAEPDPSPDAPPPSQYRLEIVQSSRTVLSEFFFEDFDEPRWRGDAQTHARVRFAKRMQVLAVLSLLGADPATGGARYTNCGIYHLPMEVLEPCLAMALASAPPRVGGRPVPVTCHPHPLALETRFCWACDVCGDTPRGPAYRCTEVGCEDYDLCTACFDECSMTE